MFDIDGTLVDSDAFEEELFLTAINDALNVTVSCDWHKYDHVTDSGILHQIIDTHSSKADREQLHFEVKTRFVQLTHEHIQKNPGSIREIQGAREFMLELLKSSNTCVAIATGGWEETAKLKLDAIGIDPDGLPFASGSDAISRANIMKLAEARTTSSAPFTKKTYLGDRSWDKKASAELGYNFIAVGDKVDHYAQIPDYSSKTKVLELIGL
ncbi:MAG: HAD hydrolase-like protein [Gammaproteobacteria bacterium]|nr:HAD hydrolase-like protein [Gammaproteobacteria bacterium]